MGLAKSQGHVRTKYAVLSLLWCSGNKGWCNSIGVWFWLASCSTCVGQILSELYYPGQFVLRFLILPSQILTRVFSQVCGNISSVEYVSFNQTLFKHADTKFPHLLVSSSPHSDCVSTYNDTLPFWRDTKINNDNRSWLWIVWVHSSTYFQSRTNIEYYRWYQIFSCNEVGWYQDTPPKGHPALVSRLVKPAYDEVCPICSFIARTSSDSVGMRIWYL